MILIDTSIIIDLLKGTKEAISIIKTLPPHQLYISAVTYAEIELGFTLLQSKKNKHEHAIFLDLIKNQELTVLPIHEDIARKYAQIQAALLAHGHQLSQFDATIAATALTHGLTLLTRDNDFKRVKDLKIFPLK